MKIPALFLAVLLPGLRAAAQNTTPTAQPITDTIPVARDVVRPGVVQLHVDARDHVRGIFRVQETIPAGPGPLTLLYPKWLPGHHSPTGPIAGLAGLEFSAGGRPLAWRRDPVDMFAFQVEVPAGATAVEAKYQFLTPTDVTQGRIVATSDMLNLQWDAVTLYPAGFYARGITVAATARYPEGWRAASALEVAGREGAVVSYRPVPLDVLVDSPVFAGANVRVETLAPDVRLNIVADEPEQLAATEAQLAVHRNLVTQADKLFGARHYDHYDFLLALSGRQSGIGLEHHRSSENGVTGGYFIDWKDSLSRRVLLAHEYTHSWNGKFRRGADLWTPDYRTPMRDSLLWVYEGQTTYWGYVLAARAGLLTPAEARDALATLAGRLATDPGRQWRPLADTTEDPIISHRSPKGWRSWQRSEDYYNEGLLIWLDVDTRLRELSGGQHSLDDFARAFFGMRGGDWGELPYEFADVVRTLNEIQPHDWAAFLHERVDNVRPQAPLDGFTRGGYRLTYTDTPGDWFKSFEKARKLTDLTYSGGFILGKEGEVIEVIWDGAAFNAGLTVGSKVLAVNGRALEIEPLKAALKAGKSPLSLLVKTGDRFRTLELQYTNGLRYPHLERIGNGPASLDEILKPKP